MIVDGITTVVFYNQCIDDHVGNMCPITTVSRIITVDPEYLLTDYHVHLAELCVMTSIRPACDVTRPADDVTCPADDVSTTG